MDRKYLNLFSVPIQTTKLELNIDSLIEFCYEMNVKTKKELKNQIWEDGTATILLMKLTQNL